MEGRELFEAARKGDGEAISQLVKKNQGLVYCWAIKFCSAHPKFDLEELVQEGNIGLLRAIALYNPKRFKTQFSTYATYWIKNLIHRFIKNNRTQIYVPIYVDDFLVHGVLKKKTISRKDLENNIGRRKVSWLHNFRALQIRASENIDVPLAENSGKCDYNNSLRELLIFGIKKHLSEKEYADLAIYHYGLKDGKIKTLEETADKFKRSREWVRLILRKINPLIQQLVPLVP